MLKIKLKEDTSVEIIAILVIIGLPLLMFLINYLMGEDKTAIIEKKNEKTVIITRAKQSDTIQPPPPKSVVNSVREAIKKGNYSTAYMEINNSSKGSPGSENNNKQIAEETQKPKTQRIRKEAGSSSTAPIRYLDESTPRNRATDAIYIYFVDVSGMLLPHFCIQAAAKRPLGVTGFTITADSKKIEIIAAPVKVENTEKGVAEWYDIPLDRHTYEAVQAMIKAKRVTLAISGSKGNATREVTDLERKAMRNILDGYAALGGSLSYLQTSKPEPSASKARHP